MTIYLLSLFFHRRANPAESIVLKKQMNSIPSQWQQSQSAQQPQSVTTVSSPTEQTPATRGVPVRSPAPR